MILTAENATDPATAGGKGASLAALTKAGFQVPPFCVLQASAFSGDPTAPTPKRGLKTALAKAAATLGSGPYAVRSSARAEDGAEHSHAGQFDTVLNVPKAGLLDAAAQVWSSGFAATVTTYRDLKTGDAPEPPAIVIQQMIPAEAAGVAFSADPVTGLRDHVVISAIKGLGEALVSGEEDGEDWLLDASDTPLTAPETPDVLTIDQATEIAALARAAEAAFGAPQDIEWAIADGALHMLQSRPITTDLKAPAQPDTNLVILDNSNIVESYPGLVSPLTYSFATYVYARVYRAFVRLLGVSEPQIATNAAVFDNMLARLDGRVYYNLGNWYRALALLPGFTLNRAFMETMMGVDEPLPEELTQAIAPPDLEGWAKWRDYGRVAKVGGGLIWQAIRLPRTRARFYERLNKALSRGDAHKTANLTELAVEYRAIESELLDQWDAPLVNDFLCMIGFGLSRNLLEKWAGPKGLSFHNDVMIGQGDIVSAEPAQRIAKIGAMVAAKGEADAGFAAKQHPEIATEIDSYLAKFGDRCTQELKLESIPLSDDPAQLYAAISAQAARPVAAYEHADPDWSALIANPVKRTVAKAVTTWAKARVRDRENLRFERTRIFGHARRIFLAMGRELTALGKLSDPRDVFYLTVDEVLGAIEGSGLTQGPSLLVSLRKAETDASAARPDPNERLTIRGAAITAPVATSAPPPPEGDLQQATGCSAGIVTAKARVILDPRTESLTPGDILIARNTDPGWIAVFSNASAIVVERGSLLSHSAIVARELGIPCVVGLKGATEWVTSGETLEVNGETGTVRKLT